MATKKQKPYVHSSTVRKNVGGGTVNPGQSKVVRIGKHKLLISRDGNSRRNGSPMHTVTLIKKDGSLGVSYRNNGTASLVASIALRRNGIDVKR